MSEERGGGAVRGARGHFVNSLMYETDLRLWLNLFYMMITSNAF